jgi:pimeloyl-ACP methyl ester carboxylesterase
MVPAAMRLQSRYKALQMPVTIIAGSEDRIASPRAQSERLHRELPASTLTVVRGEGHMLQHLVPAELLRAVLDVPKAPAPRAPALLQAPMN